MAAGVRAFKKLAAGLLILLSGLTMETTLAATASGGPFAWTPETDCSTCHVKHVDSMTDSDLLASKHAKSGHDKCMDCHEPALLKKTHAQIPSDDNTVQPRKYPQDFCLKCHGTYAELAQRTADKPGFKDKKGIKSYNPHDLPQGEGHKSVKECSNCHKMHKASYNPINYCFSCHHKRIFECGTCH